MAIRRTGYIGVRGWAYGVVPDRIDGLLERTGCADVKVCAEADCPELTNTTRCQAHTRAKDKARGTRQERGYDRAYELHREREARKVASGKATCWQCLLRISPLEPWDDGHCDNDKATIHGAQHRACNRDVTSLGACAHVSHETHNATP